MSKQIKVRKRGGRIVKVVVDNIVNIEAYPLKPCLVASRKMKRFTKMYRICKLTGEPDIWREV